MTGTDTNVDRFEAILRSTPWFMEALLAARRVAAPDCLIGAGAIRNAVWDHLHGFSEPTPPADIDLVFFDSSDMSVDRERQVEEALTSQLRGVPWQARTQAAVHLWFPQKFGYEVEPFGSTAEGNCFLAGDSHIRGGATKRRRRSHGCRPMRPRRPARHGASPKSGTGHSRGVRAPAGDQANRRALAAGDDRPVIAPGLAASVPGDDFKDVGERVGIKGDIGRLPSLSCRVQGN